MFHLPTPIKFSKTFLLVLIPIVFFLFLACFKIKYPGMQFDEIIFGNAAWGMIDGSFVSSKIGRFPLYIVPYTGALKAYFFYPIFKLFGASVFSIRIPLILLGAGALFLNFWAFKKFAGRKIAFFTVLILSVDPSFINFMRQDVGPTVIEYFLKSLILLSLVIFLQKGKLKNLIFILFLAFLGVFNKLNFIWLINSLFFGVLICYFPVLKNKFQNISQKKQVKILSWSFLGYFSLAGFFLLVSYFNNLFGSLAFSTLPQKISFIFWRFRELVIGNAFYNYAMGDLASPLDFWYLIFVLTIIAIGLLLVFLQRKKIKVFHLATFGFFLFVPITLFAQIVLTKEATAPWHVFTLYPFFTFLLVFSLSLTSRFVFLKSKNNQLIFYLAILAVFCFQIGKDFVYIKAYDTQTKNVAWSSAIYELSEYTKQSSAQFVSADWGIHNQILVFYGKSGKYEEMSFKLQNPKLFTPEDIKRFNQIFLRPENNFLFITHSDENSIFSEAKKNLFQIAKEENISLKLIKTISDGDKVIFEIYEPKSLARPEIYALLSDPL